ncbi:MAG: hypothetical protein KDD43_01685 [Bdellovibrionales bacterium]|nr:hypothetical protein [Bdellovibrionales bacterium]
MSALSANTLRSTYGKGPTRFTVKSGSTIYVGSLVGIEAATGHIKPFVTGAGIQFVGMALEKVVGDGSLDCLVDTEGFNLSKVSVTGVSAITDIGSPVYASNDNDLTLTRPDANTDAVGYVSDWDTGSTCDVRIFSAHEIEVMAAGLTNQTIAGLTMVDGTNVVLGSTTGTKIGTATSQKLGFFNATPVVQPSAPTAAETTLTNAGTASDYAIQAMTNSSPFGFVTQAEGETVVEVVLNNQARIGEIVTALQALGLMA